MSVVKVRPRRQVTIPKEIFNKLHLEEGDFIEAKAEDQKIVLVPQKLVAKTGVVPLSKEEQKTLKTAQTKIERIKQALMLHPQLDILRGEIPVQQITNPQTIPACFIHIGRANAFKR